MMKLFNRGADFLLVVWSTVGNAGRRLNFNFV